MVRLGKYKEVGPAEMMVSELGESYASESIKSINHPVMLMSPKYKYSYGRYACIVGTPTGVAATSTVRA